MPTPKLPWSQGGDAKGFRGISCTLGLLGSLGTLSLGNARLLRQTYSLPFRAAWPYPSRLLTADTILGDDPRKEQSGLSILCRDTGPGPMVGYHSQEFPRYFRVSHQKYLLPFTGHHARQAQCAPPMRVNLQQPPCHSLTVIDTQSETLETTLPVLTHPPRWHSLLSSPLHLFHGSSNDGMLFKFVPFSPPLKWKLFKDKDLILFTFVFSVARLVPAGEWRHGVNISGLCLFCTQGFLSV